MSNNMRGSLTDTYKCVDVMKLIFCMCVIGIHTNVLKMLPDIPAYFILKGVLRLAVPYFFVASGFFLGKRIYATGDISNSIKTYIVRLLKPYIVFETISLLQNAFLMFRAGKTVRSILRFTVKSLLFYPQGSLWFIWASIIAACLIFPFLKRNWLNFAMTIGLLLYTFAIICNNYYFVICGTWMESIVKIYLQYFISPRNGIFTGFIFIVLGLQCERFYRYKLQFFNKRMWLYMLTIVMYFVYLCEIAFVWYWSYDTVDDGSLYILHILFIPCLFFLTLYIPIHITAKSAVLCRNLSTGMYFLHRPIMWCLDRGVDVFPILSFLHNPLLYFSLVAFFAGIVCVFAYKTKKEPIYSLLR